MKTLKQTQSVTALANAVGRAAGALSRQVVARVARDGLKGREEIITPQIAGELTGHLVESVRKEIKELDLVGVRFEVHCYNKSEENRVGADLAGVVRISDGTREIAKGFLAQAKVATSALRVTKRDVAIRAGDTNLLRQCRDMLNHSPSSYVFTYSKFGIHVIPATNVKYKNAGRVDTTKDYYQSLAGFYTDFFKCFVGDPKLGRSYRRIAAKPKGNLADALNADRAIAIEAEIEDDAGE